MSRDRVTELLVGFDAREMWRDYRRFWEAIRIKSFLLKPDVAKPLSVDWCVWPSVFDVREFADLTPSERNRLGLGGLPLPEWTGPNRPLWARLADLEQHLEQTSPGGAYWVVALSVAAADRAPKSAPTTWPSWGRRMTSKEAGSWECLGIDVASRDFHCSLTSRGYSDEDKRSYTELWSAHLNRFHLFSDTRPAYEYAESNNALIPEFAPFVAYCIRLVRAHEPDQKTGLPWI